MTTLVVQHTVESYDDWKPGFDAHEENRRLHGSTGHRLLRDGNAITILMDFPDRKSAQEFVDDPSLRAAMEKAGVITGPSIAFDEDVETLAY